MLKKNKNNVSMNQGVRLMMKERQKEIQRYIERKGEVTLSELAEEFSSWSEMTIRRDLDYLEQNRVLLRTKHGARIMPSIYDVNCGVFGEREKRNPAEKMEIARKAAEMITSDMSIFVDAGSTAMAFAHCIPDRDLIVITSAPNVGLEIAMRTTKPTVIFLGGPLIRKTMNVAGLSVLDQLKNLNIDTAFMSASGYTDATGFSISGQQTSILKRTVVNSARRVVMMIDSSKFCSIYPYTFARANEIDTVVSDSGIPQNIKNGFLQEGVKVL